MSVSHADFEQRFRAHVADFFNGDADNDFHIELKLRHSLRVYELARRIVREEAIPAPAADAALTSALFHDTGRFVQYQRYRSFHDPSTENHARLGIRALLSTNLLKGLPNDARRTVLGAVFLHNVRTLPPNLREPLSTVVKVVRDSDKLDIVPVVLEHLDASAEGSSVVTLGIKSHPTNYTRSIYEQVLAGESAKYEEMCWAHDFRLLVLGWLYDLNFPTSKRLYVQRGYLETLFAALPDDEPMRALRRKILGELTENDVSCGCVSALD
jgi:HD superfamily phosphodiesterase